MKKKLIFQILLFFILVPVQVLAICEGPIVPCGRSGVPPCNLCHLFELLSNVLNYILTCLTPIVGGLVLVVGGIYFLISGASPAKVSQAKGIVTAVVIGLVILFMSWVFLNTFLTTIGVADWTGLGEGEWWEIDCQP